MIPDDFVWPSDQDRADDDELNRVCVALEETADAAEATSDYAEDRAKMIGLLAAALNVHREPHQSFDERLLEAAEVRQGATMSQTMIRELALRHGFTLKAQQNGDDDLHDYVYAFARDLLLVREAPAEPDETMPALDRLEWALMFSLCHFDPLAMRHAIKEAQQLVDLAKAEQSCDGMRIRADELDALADLWEADSRIIAEKEGGCMATIWTGWLRERAAIYRQQKGCKDADKQA